MKHNKWGFQNVDAYHQAYITDSKTQPSARILFNKALDINTNTLKPWTLKTLHTWWTVSKFRESKGYLWRQYEHGMYTAINTKAVNFLIFPICRYSEKSKKKSRGEMTYLTKPECWTQLVSEQHWCEGKFLRQPPTTSPFWAPQRLQLPLVRVPEEDAVSSSISEPQLQKMLFRKRKEKKVWH